MPLQRVVHGLVFGQPQSIVQGAQIKWLGYCAIFLFNDVEAQLVPLGLLQNHVRNIENRIRPARHTNLARESIGAFFVNGDVGVNFRQWLLGAPLFAFRLAVMRPAPGSAAPIIAPAVIPAAFVIAAWRALLAGGGFLAPRRSAFTGTWAIPSTITPAVTTSSRSFAFLTGVMGKAVGGGRFRGPGGQE
jgi:hypothetical protein